MAAVALEDVELTVGSRFLFREALEDMFEPRHSELISTLT